MEALFFGYYQNGARVITCLLISSDLVLAKGIAICSDRDQFNRQRGQDIAHGRAIKAWMNHGYLRDDSMILPSFHFHILRPSVKEKLVESGHFPLVFQKGIAYPPENCLTEKEKKAIEILKD